MKAKKITISILVFSLFVLSLIGSSSTTAQYNGRKIVTFDEKVVNEKAFNILRSVGGAEVKPLPIINGYSVVLPSAAAERALEGKVGVNRIEDDIIVKALGKPGPAPQPVESLEWNVSKIKANSVWATSSGTGIKVAVIDTGIDKDHPDLIANIKGGRNYIIKKGSVNPANWDDDNGHGTHVAGIIAASDNEIGVIGVAPTADLYAVKVLNRNGSGSLSDVIAGIDWAVGNNMDVINMSLGADSSSLSFKEAVDNAYSAGVVVVAAAGNDGAEVDYPAAYGSVIAVAATNSSNVRPSWSSFGPEVELSAPGVYVRSTWKDNGYNTISGTSMASPHVAGTAALILASPVLPGFDADTDGVWDASEVRSALQATADNLGAPGFDNYYGFGLVDAKESVTGTP